MSTPANTLPPARGARTLERAFGVLDSFTLDSPRWRTTELAQHRGLPVPTTHRILRMLERFDYVIRDRQTGAYELGPAAASFARERESPVPARLRDAALPLLHAVHHATGADVSLSALSESRAHAMAVCVVGTEQSSRRARVDTGATYLVVLAHTPDDELGRQPSRLRRELLRVRRRGWAFSREEAPPDSWTVAVPVFGCFGSTPFAVAIKAPLVRLDRERAQRHLSLLRFVARRLPTRVRDQEHDQLTTHGAA